MMETLALSSTDNQNNQTLHVAAAGGTFYFFTLATFYQEFIRNILFV